MIYKEFVFNKGEFIKTKFCTPNISGLIVEFSKDDHGDDINKYKKYTEDESFIPFQNLVKEFGFTLDRHAPWRMVFDIGSPSAARYLTENYQISSTKEYIANNYYLSDYYVQNASFLRMDNINIGYNVGKVFHNKANLKINANVQNAFIITQYKGLDPEVNGGIDNNFYPRPRTFVLGLNLNF